MRVKEVSVGELRKLCAEWQRRLRLMDWKIYVELVAVHHSVASVYPHPESKSARIKLNINPSRKEYSGCLDVEVSLVHELLHLHTRGFAGVVDERWRYAKNIDKREKYENYEAMVELVAEALVSAKRGKRVRR